MIEEMGLQDLFLGMDLLDLELRALKEAAVALCLAEVWREECLTSSVSEENPLLSSVEEGSGLLSSS
jgi:hypothetical protein